MASEFKVPHDSICTGYINLPEELMDFDIVNDRGTRIPGIYDRMLNIIRLNKPIFGRLSADPNFYAGFMTVKLFGREDHDIILFIAGTEGELHIYPSDIVS